MTETCPNTPTPESLRLRALHQFVDVDDLRRAIAGTDGSQLFQSLVRVIDYTTRMQSVATKAMQQIRTKPTKNPSIQKTSSKWSSTPPIISLKLSGPRCKKSENATWRLVASSPKERKIHTAPGRARRGQGQRGQRSKRSKRSQQKRGQRGLQLSAQRHWTETTAHR